MSRDLQAQEIATCDRRGEQGGGMGKAWKAQSRSLPRRIPRWWSDYCWRLCGSECPTEFRMCGLHAIRRVGKRGAEEEEAKLNVGR